MKRSLKIEKYRNIGIEKEEEFILNHFMEKNKMGNLVIVIGENNSGKSNVLDALLAIGNKQINRDRDATNLRYEEKYQNPKLTIEMSDLENCYQASLQCGSRDFSYSYPTKVCGLNSNEAVEVGKQILDLDSSYRSFPWLKTMLDSAKSKSTIEELKNNIDKIIKETIRQNHNGYFNGSYRAIWTQVVSKRQDWIEYYSNDKTNIALKEYKDKYGSSFVPQILKYEEKKITQSMLHCSPSDVDRNVFMSTLLQEIKVKGEDINTAYKDFHRTDNKGILQKLEQNLNKKIKKVSDKFNSVYFFGKENYKFRFSLESGRIDVSLFRDDEPMNLDYQSLGFRWFFNLYFNLLSTTKLNAGDIIIMDDPPFANLSVNAQPELRKYLKEFAIKSGVTIVIATQSPFVVDLDFLDELRVVSLKDNIVHIENDFSAIHHEDPDALASIKRALTVNQNILLDEEKKIIFVEGITDYNYMVTFKNLLGEKYNKFCFLPIGGVGDRKASDYKEKQKEISKALNRLRRREPILMVDGDTPGTDMKNLNKNSDLSVFTLSEVNESFKNIEDLFSKNDKEKYKIAKKSSARSAQFKTYTVEKNDIEKETLDNFIKLFDYIDKIND